MKLKSVALVALIAFAIPALAQKMNDSQFEPGWLLLLKLNNGMVTNFKATPPDMYAGGISLNPQVTIVKSKMRAGANAGFVYTGKKSSGMFGPMLSYKIKNLNILNNTATFGNLHLIAEANWGTNKQQLAGGGLAIETAGKRIHISFTAQRDYNLNYWWFQSHIGIRLARNKVAENEP